MLVDHTSYTSCHVVYNTIGCSKKSVHLWKSHIVAVIPKPRNFFRCFEKTAKKLATKQTLRLC